MQEHDVLREFPEPPRKFRGHILDPMLVVEDYDYVVGVTRRFAERNPGFTDEGLIAFLALKNGVKLYGSQGDWDALFADARDSIVEEAENLSPPVHISWAIEQIGERITYTMVQTPSVIASPAEPALRVSAEVLDAPVPPPQYEVLHPDQPTFDYLQLMLSNTGGGVMAMRDIRELVGRKFRVGADEAGRRIQSAVTAGIVHHSSQRGMKMLHLGPAEEVAVQVEAEAEQADEAAHIEALADLDAYFEVVRFVMSTLASLRDISMGQPFDKLWNRSKHKLEETMDFDGFKRYIRRMEIDGLVRIEKNAKLSTRTSHSQIIRGSKVFAATKEIKASWKVNGRENWKAMYEDALGKLLDEHAE